MGEKVSAAPPADGWGESLRRLPVKREATRTSPSSAACGRQLPPRGEAFKETAMKGIKTHDPLRTNARNLRKSMTPQERRLWYDFLKNLPQTVTARK